MRGGPRAVARPGSATRAATPAARVWRAGRRLVGWVWPRPPPAERPEPPNPHRRLAVLIAQGRAEGADYLALCLQAGLHRRAEAAALQIDPADLPARTRMALAAMRRDRAALAHELELAARDFAAGGPDALDALQRAEAALPAVPDLALAWFERQGLAHPARRAWRGGEEPVALPPSPHDARWAADALLVEANLRAGTLEKLDLLNAMLARQGLRPVSVGDPRRPLSVGNLAGLAGLAEPAESIDGPLASVIVTCYDNAELIEPSLRSLLRQTYRSIELIVVDDASRDDTADVLRRLGAVDTRLRSVRLPSNVGTYAAKNVGLAMARGEFVAFQDADDWSHPERIAQGVAALQAEPRRVAVSGLYARLDAQGRFVSQVVWPLLRWTPNSVVMRRRPVLERIGHFDEHRFGCDSEYVARLRAAFGEAAHHKLRTLAMLASHRAGSLTTDARTGLDPLGLSPVRRRFEEGWSEALLQRLVDGRSLYRAPGEATPPEAAADGAP